MENTFTLDDLETGMVVTTRNGDEFIVIRDVFAKDTEENGPMDMLVNYRNTSRVIYLKMFGNYQYDSNFNHVTEDDFDIIKISKLNNALDCFLCLDKSDKETIWEREKAIEKYHIYNIIDELSGLGRTMIVLNPKERDGKILMAPVKNVRADDAPMSRLMVSILKTNLDLPSCVNRCVEMCDITFVQKDFIRDEIGVVTKCYKENIDKELQSLIGIADTE